MIRLPRPALLAAAVAGGIALASALRWQVVPPTGTASPWTRTPVPVPLVYNVDSLARAVLRAAPFRERRVLAQMAFDPAQPSGAPPAGAPQGPPKPAIQLVGIAWGAAPVALLDGIPGAERSRAMQRGDTAGGLRLRRISPREVVMTGYDTTWTLRIREFR